MNVFNSINVTHFAGVNSVPQHVMSLNKDVLIRERYGYYMKRFEALLII